MEIDATTQPEPVLKNPEAAVAAVAHPEIIACKNCDNQFRGNFCNNCGQSAHTHPINWHYVVHDIQHGVFHVDKGILYTIKELFLKPGVTIRHFIHGKRVDYFKPIALVFILSGIYGFLYHYFDIHMIPQLGPQDTPEAVMMKKSESWMASHYSLVMLAATPFYTLASYLAFRKSRYNFMEQLVVNLYMLGLNLVVQIVLFPVVYLAQTADLSGIIITISIFSSLSITFYVYCSVFNMFSKVSRVLRTLLSYFLASLFSMTVGIIIGVIISIAKLI